MNRWRFLVEKDPEYDGTPDPSAVCNGYFWAEDSDAAVAFCQNKMLPGYRLVWLRQINRVEARDFAGPIEDRRALRAALKG